MTLKSISFLFISLGIFCACNGDSAQLQTELESLRSQVNEQANQIKSYDDFVNLVNTAMDSIVMADGSFILGDKPGTTREQIRSNLNAYEETLKRYRIRIEELTKQLDLVNSAQAANMKKAIAKITEQLTTKQQEIANLRNLIDNKNVNIAQLQNKVEKLGQNITELTDANRKQNEDLRAQDAKLNEAYFIIGSKKELKDSGILSKGNLLSKSKVDLSNTELSKFTKIDIRDQKTFHIPSKNAKIMTTVPPGSYTMDISGNSCTLTVIDTNKFWSVNRYLVIQY